MSSEYILLSLPVMVSTQSECLKLKRVRMEQSKYSLVSSKKKKRTYSLVGTARTISYSYRPAESK